MKKAFVLLSAIAVLLSACSSDKENKTEAGKYPIINPLVIDTVFITEYVADIHSLQNVEIRARVKGYVEEILVDEGKPVKAGQTLFTINSKQYQQELVKAKALLKSAIADAKSAELEVKNVQILLDKSVVSKTELEMAQSKFDAANAKVDEAKSDEASAALNLLLTEIKAPFDGVINRIPNKVGSLIDEGTLLTSISNNKDVFAYFNVSEREYLDISVQIDSSNNNEVELVLANNKLYPIKGKIETVEGEFNKATGNIAFRARFTNPNNILKNGSSGKILLRKQLKAALIIPQKSTFEVQEKACVFVIDKDNTVLIKTFVPKLRIPYFYVVESGLMPSDKIIYEGIQLVKEGDKIIPEIISSKQMLIQH
ncbi:MAG: efflux RND transporter periplasmic adaptor subunit [Bacteroidia bacterium]